MAHIPLRVELPRGFAQNVTKDKQTAFKDLPCRWIASQLDSKSRATGTKATILRLISVWASRKQRLVFCRGEVVGSLRQADLVLSLAACRRALREVGHGVVAQQHHGFCRTVGRRGVWRTAGAEPGRNQNREKELENPHHSLLLKNYAGQ